MFATLPKGKLLRLPRAEVSRGVGPFIIKLIIAVVSV